MIVDFIRILRAADIRVSPAEVIDAVAVINTVGMSDKRLLKHALSHSLAKTGFEKQAFDACFDSYFTPPESTDETTTDDAAANDPPPQHGDGSDDNAAPESASANAGQNEDGVSASHLADMIEQNDQAAIQAAIAGAANAAGVHEARLFTQQGMFTRRILEAIGLDELDRRIAEMRDSGDTDHRQQLEKARARLFNTVHDFVERQIAMRTKNAGRLLREDALSRIRLNNLDKSDMKIMRGLIQKMAKRLASRYARRRKKARRGILDIRRTMRRNLTFDGNLFRLSWRRTKVERPRLIVLCDVSGSVAAVSRFFLMFLYSLDEVMVKTRSFVFSNRAGEISDLLRTRDIDAAMEEALRLYGGGSTDYGMALHDLADAISDKVNNKTTIMVLGDARSNYGNPGHRVLKELHERARRVLWLNPEPEAVWNSGDSEMRRLGAYCTHVQTCNSVRHVERVLDDLLRSTV